MYKLLKISKIQLFICLSGIINLYNCVSKVKMEVSVNAKYTILSCYVKYPEAEKKTYLFCPLDHVQTHCLENCVSTCHGEDCLMTKLITCDDRGFNKITNESRIDYVIDGTVRQNKGNWKCQNSGKSSAVIYVNVTSSKNVIPIKVITTNKPPSESFIKSQIDPNKVPEKELVSSTKIEDTSYQYDKILSRTEFIFTVVALLALSLVINIIFCSKMIVKHCRSKKKDKSVSQYLLSNNNHPPYNHSSSQVSDPERIYEDTSFNPRQMSFLTQIKNGNGTYMSPSTLAPSGFSTLLPHAPLNFSFSNPNSACESGSQQVIYPISSNPSQSNYTSINFPPENNYTNFVSVPPEMCHSDGNKISQPVYLAFQSPHTILTAGNRYMHYGNQPLQSVATMSKDQNMSNKPETPHSTMPHSSSINFSNGSEEAKSNYQLSREMMEEADYLLRTADTLLKSSENEIQYYKQ